MARATGKDHARINLDIWGNEDWLDLTPSAQHLYFVLWTSPQLSYCGTGDWHPGKIASKAQGWSAEAVCAAAVELSSELFLIIDTDTEEFILRSWIKHDALWRTPNMAVSMANARADLASRTLRAVIIHEVKKLKKNHPDSTSWQREAVVNLLSEKSIDAATLPPYPGLNPSPNPPPNPGVNPPGTAEPNPTANPASNPGATPAPSPTPTSLTPIGGYVSQVSHQEPPRKCPRHINLGWIEEKCPDCAELGRAHDAWKADELNQRRRQRQQRLDAIAACQLCDENGNREVDEDLLTHCDHEIHESRGVAQ